MRSAAIVCAVVLASSPASADETWVSTVSQATRNSVVRVDCGAGLGSGFVFHTSRHVATAFHVIEVARPITVKFADGTTRSATIKAVDTDHDLAILELGAAATSQPLALDTEGVAIGASVMAIGHPFANVLPMSGREGKDWKGLLAWTVTTGVISATSSTRIQTDTAINPGNSGGPLIGADGRVLGVVVEGVNGATGLSFAIRASHLAELTAKLEAGTAPTYRGSWSGNLVVSPLVGHFEGHGPTLGSFPSMGIGLDFVKRDRYVLAIGGGSVGTEDALAGPVLTRSIRRTFIEAKLGYRHLMTWSDHNRAAVVGVALGGLLTRDRITERGVDVVTDPMCDPMTTACTADAVGTEAKSVRWNLRPMASAWIDYSRVRFGYSIAIDPTDAGDRTQSLTLGLKL